MVYEIVQEIISTIAALAATVYLFITANHTKNKLKSSLMFLAFGVLIAVGAHSFFEALEAIGYISTDALLQIMPPLILVGSLFIMFGTYNLYHTIKSIKK